MELKPLQIVATVFSLLALAIGGCATAQRPFDAHGVVFYCDGAGGDGLTNWGPGVKKGLLEAGFNGTFDEFSWETGLGVVADQVENVPAKRAQAEKLARQILKYQAEFPGSPVHMMGLSAGTAIAVFTLEALPADAQVDTVVLLSSSLASDHDLSRALPHLRGDLYATVSPNDAILQTAVPTLGSADREFVGEEVVGLDGFAVPADASPATR